MSNKNEVSAETGGSLVVKLVETLAPDYVAIKTDIGYLKVRKPKASRDELAELFADRSRRMYTSYGIVSALPSVIPGVGTVAQIGIEAGTILGDLAYMIRHMARMAMGIAIIYGHDTQAFDSQEFLKLLGYWCGVLRPVGDMLIRIGTKKAIVMVNKNLTKEVLKKINQKIGMTIFTKYGTKRGGIALGRMIPFGIGAAIGGTFNYVTMTGFKKSAINFFRNEPELGMAS